jgi:arylsulfatase
MLYANWRAHNVNEWSSVRRRLLSAYEDTVAYVDDFLKRLEADLTGTDPVYVVHSDHGEAFGEHDCYGHERQLYEENLRVPFLIGNVSVQAEIDRPVSLRSIPDVVRRIAAGETNSIPREYGEGGWPESVIAHSTEGGRTAVRTGRYKYIVTERDDELYDLESDPGERENLADERTAVRDALRERIRAFRHDEGEKARLQSTVSRLDAGAL